MRISALPFVVLALVATWPVQAADTISVWQPHDLTLTAAQEHPWWEFPVRVLFTRDGEASPSLTVEGCWDGGKHWLVRVALPRPGVWRWRTESADAGLGGRSGSIEVVAAGAKSLATNPNLRGSVRIAADARHFEYADGTPFFLLASTLWAANTARCGLGTHQDGPFFQHLDDRQAKGFNTILMQYFHGYGDYPESPGHRNEGGKPYHDIGVKDLNPAHFQSLDTRMQALWARGLVVAVPVTWWGKTKNCVFTPEDARRVSAYCAVRYGAFNALWSLSGEYQYAFKDCGWKESDFTALGEEVQRHNPYRRPLSIHPSGHLNWPPPHATQSSRAFVGESWLDHNWLQTGQSRDRLHFVVERLEENRALLPTMPVFCSEGLYEQLRDLERAYHTRWQVWTAFLNGAAGYGYGADGLWQFYDPDDPEGVTGKKTAPNVESWRVTQNYEGSTQVIHARRLLTSFDWPNLVPARNRLEVGGLPNPMPTTTDLTPPQAGLIDGRTWILYIPRGNADRALTITGVAPGKFTARWLNPRDGAFTEASSWSASDVIPRRPSPADEDWVLVLESGMASRLVKRPE